MQKSESKKKDAIHKVKVVIGDYRSQNKDSLLKRCEDVRSDYDGIFHAGIIHYIQGKMPDFTLKCAISEILDKCPSVWPEDLPIKIERGEDIVITPAMNNEFKRLNKGLILPIDGIDIIQIIKLAKDFLKEGKETCKKVKP